MKIIRSNTLFLLFLFILAIAASGKNHGEFIGLWYGDQNPDQPIQIFDDGTYTSEELTDGKWEIAGKHTIELKSKAGGRFTLERTATRLDNEGWSYFGDVLYCDEIETSYFSSQTTAIQASELRHASKNVKVVNLIGGFWTTKEKKRETFYFKPDGTFSLTYNVEESFDIQTIDGTYQINSVTPIEGTNDQWMLDVHLMPNDENPLTPHAKALTTNGTWYIHEQESELTLTNQAPEIDAKIIFYKNITK